MPSALPEGEAVPVGGPFADRLVAAGRPLSVYVHVPYCATRCGYCDFNTYTAAELGSTPGAARAAYLVAVRRELERLAAAYPSAPEVSTVFFGGGTPTLLAASELGGLLGAVRETFGLAADAEVTTEANPETVDPRYFDALRAAGFTRVSLGMQSSDAGVLRLLERTHTAGRAVAAAREARAAGFDHVSLDLIYGTPGESREAWRRSLDDALSAGPDHVSAYSLIVEEGTRFAARVRRGDVPLPDDDDLADKYLIADEALGAAGLTAYEVSNWAAGEPARCRHNLAYWRGDDWFGVGPGAHSHLDGVRWWNVKHPARYTAAVAAGWPAAGREVLTAEERRIERVLLELRLAEGLDVGVLTADERARVPGFAASGLAMERAGRLVLTQRGRLLADGVVRDLLA